MKLLKSSGQPKKPRFFIIRQVTGESMSPTLRPEALVLGFGRPRNLSARDIVVVRHNGMEKIKRIQKITADSVWVVGDNADKSTDSRSFGWLPVDSIVAKVIWPLM